MLSEIVIAGFGGQGVMLMGQLISYAGMSLITNNENFIIIKGYLISYFKRR